MEGHLLNAGFEREAYRRRIKLVRKIFNLNQMQFAQFLGIPYKRWNHYECGYLLTRETAFILRCHVKGLSTDWLWWGDTKNMPGELLGKIRQIERQERKVTKAASDGQTRGLPKVRKRISRTDKNGK